MKEYIVDKVDAFLQYKGGELYEQARRDVLNDPAMAEHKVALDRIVDTVSEYISDEEYTLATSSKLEEAKKSIAQWWDNWGVLNWDSTVRELILIVDADNNTVHKGQCRIIEKRQKEVGKESKVKASQAWAGTEGEPWRTDPQKLQALGKWVEKPKGARGPCPVALSEKLMKALLPLELGTFFPVNVEHSSEYIPCQHCKPKTR